MIQQIRFCSEAEAVKTEPSPTTALISITNPGDAAPLRSGWTDLLRISIADASYDEQTIESYRRMWHLSSQGFPKKVHAQQIRAFLDNLPSHIDRLLIHCGAGVSRSGAVAKYAAARYGLPFDADYSRYNEALYRLLQNPNVFDSVLARFPEKKPSWLHTAVSRVRRLW